MDLVNNPTFWIVVAACMAVLALGAVILLLWLGFIDERESAMSGLLSPKQQQAAKRGKAVRS